MLVVGREEFGIKRTIFVVSLHRPKKHDYMTTLAVTCEPNAFMFDERQWARAMQQRHWARATWGF